MLEDWRDSAAFCVSAGSPGSPTLAPQTTCRGKTLEEIEDMFAADGPRPWNTRKGESRLGAEAKAVVARKNKG
jgi:hypothetical protein